MTRPDEPPVWPNDGDAPPGLSRLLSGAKHDGPSDAELSQLEARLSGVLSAPLPSSGSPAVPLFAKLGAGTVIAALAVGALVHLQHRAPATQADHPAKRAPPVADLRPPALGTATAALEPVPVVASAQLPPAAPLGPPTKKRPTGLASAAASGAATAQSEAALLEAARQALTTDPAHALALTRQHAAQFPHGSLGQEREVIAISALRRLGRTTEADARAARFDASYPKSVHQQAVDRPAPR
jgi:hypothetical protein